MLLETPFKSPVVEDATAKQINARVTIANEIARNLKPILALFSIHTPFFLKISIFLFFINLSFNTPY